MHQRLILLIGLLTCHFVASAQNSGGVKMRFVLSEKFEVVDSTKVKHGRYRYFCDEHQLIEGFYVNGEKSGYWEYFDNEGNVRLKGLYANDLQQGTWKNFYKSGALAGEVNYVDGKQQGPAKGYHENSTVASHGIFNNNFKDSIWTTYTADGKLFEKIYYSNGGKDSVYHYYENGNVAHINTFNGRNRVRTTEYLKSGKLFLSMQYKDGLLDACTTYDAAGAPLAAGDFKYGNGVLHRYFYPDEKAKEYSYPLFATITYVNGVANGPAEFFNKNGEVINRGSFTDGHQTGKWKYWSANRSQFTEDYDLDSKRRLSTVDDFFRNADWNVLSTDPEFPGGMQALKVYLSSVPHPAEAKQRVIHEPTRIRVVIDRFGEVVEESIIERESGLPADRKLFDDAMLNHLKKMPNWIPGLEAGIPVKVQYIMHAFFNTQEYTYLNVTLPEGY